MAVSKTIQVNPMGWVMVAKNTTSGKITWEGLSPSQEKSYFLQYVATGGASPTNIGTSAQLNSNTVHSVSSVTAIDVYVYLPHNDIKTLLAQF